MRETFFLMKDFGYDDFEKNNIVISKFKSEGKLDNMMGIQQALEASYNAGNRGAPAQAAAPTQQPARQAPPQLTPAQRAEEQKQEQLKTAYNAKVTKAKLKDPVRTIMLQLVSLGYTDYDKNLKIVKKEKRPDIGVILDKLNKA